MSQQPSFLRFITTGDAPDDVDGRALPALDNILISFATASRLRHTVIDEQADKAGACRPYQSNRL